MRCTPNSPTSCGSDRWQAAKTESKWIEIWFSTFPFIVYHVYNHSGWMPQSAVGWHTERRMITVNLEPKTLYPKSTTLTTGPPSVGNDQTKRVDPVVFIAWTIIPSHRHAGHLDWWIGCYTTEYSCACAFRYLLKTVMMCGALPRQKVCSNQLKAIAWTYLI